TYSADLQGAGECWGSPERPMRLGEGEYFALGDFALRSADSRVWGVLPGKNIEGIVSVMYWPPSRCGDIRCGTHKTTGGASFCPLVNGSDTILHPNPHRLPRVPESGLWRRCLRVPGKREWWGGSPCSRSSGRRRSVLPLAGTR